MAREEGPPRRWLSGFGALDWGGDERAYASLLDALTRDRLSVEALEQELDATARRNLAELHKDQERMAHDELAEARRELDEFRVAIDDARQRSGPNGEAEVPYDSQDPAQNRAVDVLIQYLVRPGYAEVRTDEPQPEHYVYYIKVDFARLRELSQAQGHALPL